MIEPNEGFTFAEFTGLFFIIIILSLGVSFAFYVNSHPMASVTKSGFKTIQIEGCDYLTYETCWSDGECKSDTELSNIKLKPNGNCGNVKAK